MEGSIEGVIPARLEGGQFDGFEMTARPGQEVIELGPDGFLVLFGGPPEELARLKRTKWEYRYVRMEEGDDGPRAVFEFASEVQINPVRSSAAEPE